MYKRVINDKIDIKDFFNVYPPLVKVYSEESNKFIKLFEEPKSNSIQNKNDNKRRSSQLTITLKSIKEIDESNKNNPEKNDHSYKDSNSIDSKNKNNTKDLDQLTSESFSKKYFLINKGIELQKEKKKRTRSIKKSLRNFLYRTNVIEKLSDNLFFIEKKLNTGFLTKNDKILEAKIKNKISNIVEKLSTQLTIEKVPENKFIIKMNDIGDKCYFLLSGKLSIMKPIEYKNISLNALNYIHYLINLMKFNEIDLIDKVIEANHNYINIETISNLKIIIKGYFLRKIDNYLETFKTLTKEDFESLLDEFNLKFEDFNLNHEQTMKDIEDINNNNYKENNFFFDSDIGKDENEPKSKYILFKEYMNKFNLKFEDKIILGNYDFLFYPQEEKKLYNFTLYKYENFLNLYPGSFFGDMALESKVKKRNASIRTEEECFLLSLNNDDYISLLYEDNKKLKSMDLNFLTDNFFFNKISPIHFEKKYFSMFKFFEKNKGDIIYQQDNELSSIFFLKKGEYKLEIKSSVIDLHNLIKYFIDILEEKNYLNYSKKYIDNLKDTYLKDPELLNLTTKNHLYKEKFNEKQTLETSIIKNNEILGDLELFLTSAYIGTCTVISQTAEYMEIKKRDLSDIFTEEKEILPNYYIFVTNKLILQIKRFYYLKNNLISRIKSKINDHFYQPLISPNFYEQIKNNNTNDYFRDKRILKLNMPKVFKYSHLSPPIIHDSNWNPKKFDQEEN